MELDYGSYNETRGITNYIREDSDEFCIQTDKSETFDQF